MGALDSWRNSVFGNAVAVDALCAVGAKPRQGLCL